MEIELVGLDFGEIEDVIEQVEQVSAASRMVRTYSS
jgi:hypothetical protein